MSENDVNRLKELLGQAPKNSLLRITLIRCLIAAKEDSQALALALDADLSDVRSASDRRILSDLFRRAGLDEHAERLNDDAHSMLDEEPDYELPNSVTSDDAEPEPSKPANLRLVGGTDVPEE